MIRWSRRRPPRAPRRTRAAVPAPLALAVAALLAIAAGAALAAPTPPRGLARAPEPTVPVPPAPAFFPASPDVQVNVDPGNLVNDGGCAVATSPAGDIHVVWNGDESQKSVWYARSTDGGLTYSTPVRLNDAVAYPPSFSVYQPDIALGPDGTVYVVWFDYRAWTSDFDYGARIDCYLDRSTDGGTTWGVDVLASVGGSGTYPWHFQPYLAVDPSDGEVFVSFTDYDRFLPEGDPSDVSLARSADGGLSFAPKVRVEGPPPTTLAAQSWSSVAVSRTGGVVVAFEDARGSSRDIRVAHSPDGVTFTSDVIAHADTTGPQLSPDVEVDAWGRVHLVWIDWSLDPDPTTAPFEDRVRYASAPAGGAPFGAAATVTDAAMQADIAFDWPPRVAVDRAGTVHVVWFDRRNDTTFCWIDRSADGVAFGSDEVVHADRGAGSHVLPRVSMLGDDDPCVAWLDRRNGANLDVFASRRKAVVAVEDPASTSLAALALHPNPARGPVAVRFALARAATARLEVLDLHGRTVRVLADGPLAAGEHARTWDGADREGRPLPAGAYWVRLAAGEVHATRAALRLR